MKYPHFWYWLFCVALILAVYAVCRAISPRFLVRRVAFGTFAVLFDMFTAWLVILMIWPEPLDFTKTIWHELIVILPFALIGYVFTWRFGFWHLRAVSN